MRFSAYLIVDSASPDSQRGNAREIRFPRENRVIPITGDPYFCDSADRDKHVAIRSNPPYKTLGLSVEPCGVGFPGDLIVELQRTSSKLDV